MEHIGQQVQALLKVAASPPAPSLAPAVRPALLDKTVDYDIPRKVWSNWIPDRGQREIVRALSDAERQAVVARRDQLENGLIAFGAAQRDEVDASLQAMLGGFRSMRQQGEDVDAITHILRAVLRNFPAWVITEACLRIARNEAGLDPRYPPNDAQIHDLCEAIVKPYRKCLVNAQALLTAQIER